LDKGFNPTPFWAAIAGTIAILVPLELSFLHPILFNLDVGFIAVAVMLIWKLVDRKLALFTAILCITYFGSFESISGGYIQYAWYFFLTVAIIAYHHKRITLSALTLSLATALHAFSILFIIPFVLLAVYKIMTEKKYKDFCCTFLMYFFITLLINVSIGSIYARRTTISYEWYNKITIHKSYITGEVFNIGLPNLLSTIVTSETSAPQSYKEDYAVTKKRNDAFQKYQFIVYNISAFICY